MKVWELLLTDTIRDLKNRVTQTLSRFADKYLKIIDRYLLREIFFYFLVAFLFFFFIFVGNILLLYAEKILSRKVPILEVILLILYSVPLIITYTVPFGILVGGLMGMGRLSADNEIMALRASGVSLYKIFVPFLVLGVFLSFVAFAFNDIFLPLGNIYSKSLLKKIMLTNPGIVLEPYSIQKYEETTIITGPVEKNVIYNITIVDRTADDEKRIITAEKAVLESNTQQRGVLSLNLFHVFSLSARDANKDSYEYSRAESMTYNILLKEINITMINPGASEKSTRDVYRDIMMMEKTLERRNKEKEISIERSLFNLQMNIDRALEDIKQGIAPTNNTILNLKQKAEQVVADRKMEIADSQIQRYKLEFHKKFSFSFASLCFIFFAFAVGLYTGRMGRFVGFGIGVLMSGVYWFLLFIFFRLGSQLFFPSFLSMWLPNLIVLGIGVPFAVLRVKK